MTRENWIDLASLAGLLCWVICFMWMYAISRKQNKMLDEIREQARRIEKLSKEEHNLIQEVHPQVKDIKADVSQMSSKVDEISN